MKGALLVIIQCLMCTLMAQDFEQLPVLDGDLTEWYSSVTSNKHAPIMKGTYFYHTEEEILSPGQTPFYKEGWDPNGSITFEGRQYTNLNINYHIAKDLLLIWDWDMGIKGTPSLLVDQTKVDSFSIHHSQFISNKHLGINTENPATFYRKVIKGNQVSCYARESKTGQLVGTKYQFQVKRQYFIQHDGNTHTFRSKPSLYAIFPEHKREIKEYIKSRRLSARNKESLLANVLLYLDPMLQ